MEADPSTPRPTGDTGVAQGRDRGQAGAEAGVAGRAVRDRRTGCGEPLRRPRRRRARSGRARRRRPASPAVRRTRSACSRSATGRRRPRRASRPGGCAAARRASRASAAASRIRSSVTENGEHGATPIRSIEPGDGSWCSSRARSVPASAASVVSTTESGGSPPRLCPRSIDPRVGWNRRPTSRAAATVGAEHVAAVAREHVVVVAGAGAAGAREPAEPGRGGGADHVLVEPLPDRVERGEPAEQVVLLGQPAGRPLVEVVVGVDQAGGGETAAAVDDLVRRPRPTSGPAGPGPTAAIRAPSTTMCPSAYSVPGLVDRGDRAALDHRASSRSRPRATRPAAPRRGSSRSRCSGRGSRPAPRGCRRRPGRRSRWSRSCTATTSPGVQNPHCTAPASTKACCTGCSRSPSASPSTVTHRRGPRPGRRRPGTRRPRTPSR